MEINTGVAEKQGKIQRAVTCQAMNLKKKMMKFLIQEKRPIEGTRYVR